MPKRKRVVKTKSNRNWFVASVVIILIFLFTAAILMSEERGGTNETPTQKENESTSTVISSADICANNVQCFSASCKSAPYTWECVNTTTQETYYKNCKAYWDVNIVQDFSRCTCIQGKCVAVR